MKRTAAVPAAVALAAMSVCRSVCADLDKGHRILLERGFQIHAMAVDQPEIPNWNVFDAGGWNGVDFQFNYFAPSAYLGPAPGNHVWQATYADYAHTSFSPPEAPYASNCVRIQLDDEQNLNDATVRANTASWFAAARPNYPDTILSVNQIPFAATDANFRDFLQTSQPDMLMIDSYRWTSDPSQGSRNLLSDWQRHRKFALAGNDGTGAHPIPYGFYAQAIDDYGRVPSESELRFEHFGAWAMGYTMTDDFMYNANRSYTGVESIYFVNGSQQANPTPSYYQVQQINHDGKNLGPALVRLLSTDVRFIAGQNASGSNPNPIDMPNWSQGAGNDQYLRGYTVTNSGTKNGGRPGDVLLSWFKVLDESLDGSDYSNEVYFAVTNGLVDPSGSAADCHQQIKLNFDLGATGSITTLQRLSRDTGQVEVIFLPFAPGGGLQRQLTMDLDGGTMDLFKYKDGSPFVGVSTPTPLATYWDSDGNASGNDTGTGAGLGGSGNWDAAASKWFNGTSNAPWSAGNNAVFTGTAGTVTLTAPQAVNNLTFKTTGYELTGSTLTIGGSSTVTVDTGVFATISSVVAGSFGLVKNGTGTLNLTAANTYSGGTIVNGGVLAIAGDSSLGATPAVPTTNLILNAALLRFNGSMTLDVNRMVYIGAGGATIDTIANDVTIAGQISGSSTLTKAGAGTLALTNANTYTGGTLVIVGALQISSDSSLGAVPASFTAGNVTLSGGTLRFGANLDLSNNRGVTISSSGATIDTQGFTNPSGYSPTNGFQGSGNLTKLGSGTFFASASAANTLWDGNLIIKQGIWKTNGRGGLPINPAAGAFHPAQVTLDGGTLQFNASVFLSSPDRGITVNAGGGAIDTQGFNVTWAGPIAGSSTTAILTKLGSGTLQLNSGTYTSSYVGAVAVNEGTLQLSGGGAMGDSASISLANASDVTLSLLNNETIGSLAGGGAAGGNVTLGGTTLTVGGNNLSTTYSGVISGASGKLTKTGTGTMSLSGNNTYTGATTVNAGTLALAQSLTKSASLTVAAAATAELSSGGGKVIAVPTLTIAGATDNWSGTVDLKDNNLIVRSTAGSRSADLTRVVNQIKSAINGAAGPWTGKGITSSTAAADTDLRLAVGVLLNDDAQFGGAGDPLYPTFAGETADKNAILIKSTYFGDADLTGIVDGTDYFLIDHGFNTRLSGWVNGDFDYTGTIDGTDYFLIDHAFGSQGPPLVPAVAGSSSPGFTVVPEPGVLGMGAALAGLLPRRRRDSA